jgi:hypothetical protein
VIELAAEHPLELALDATAEVLARVREGQDAEIFIDTRRRRDSRPGSSRSPRRSTRRPEPGRYAWIPERTSPP